MKKCASCKIEKSRVDFRPNKTKKDGYQSYCIPCDKEKQRNHYLNNKQKYIDKAQKKAQQKTKEWKDYKRTLKCNRCPENHPSCLQFHHLDPSKKTIAVSQIIRYWSLKRIMLEVSKCEILCANCHFKEHWID